MKRLSILVAAFIAGVFFLLAYPPFNQGYLAWFGLLPILFLLRRGRSFWSGYVWGMTVFGLGLLWLVRLSGLGWFAATLYLAIYPGLFFYLASRARGRLRDLWAAALWVVLEFILGHLFTGLPWLNLAITQHWNPLIQPLLSFGGGPLVAFLVVLANFSLFSFFSRPSGRRSAGWPGLLVVLAAFLAGQALSFRPPVPPPDAPILRFAVVQGNVPSSLRRQDPPLEPYLYVTRQLSSPVDLIIWPETTLVSGSIERPPLAVRRLLREKRAHLLCGVLEVDSAGRAYNSAALYAPGGRLLAVYRKRHLVPFGEYTPGRNLPPVRWLVERQAGFLPGLSAGDLPAGIRLPKGSGLVPLTLYICFEDIFAEAAADTQRRHPGLMITLTNDSWLGRLGAYQHLAAAALRAAENRTPLLRAANTGVSAWFDARGREVLRIEYNRAGLLVGEMAAGPAQPGLYQRAPYLPPMIAILMLILLSGWQFCPPVRAYVLKTGL
ncbi:MAG TPA: apolipoprotein N-acyltransferase [bacterium]|nr:apolipoprotein N-acyltransferase [bacterium]